MISRWMGDQRARRLVYGEDSIVTRYPGGGKTVQTKTEYLVEPRGEGRPIFLEEGNDIGKYPSSAYKITELPPQEKLEYVVGIVDRWEDIPGSPDKYLVLENGKYRIGFADSDLYGYEMQDSTTLMVDDVSERSDTKTNPIHLPKPAKLSEIGYEKVRKIVRRGDSVVLIPVFDPPVWSQKDDQGNYVILQLIVRRLGDDSIVGESV